MKALPPITSGNWMRPGWISLFSLNYAFGLVLEAFGLLLEEGYILKARLWRWIELIQQNKSLQQSLIYISEHWSQARLEGSLPCEMDLLEIFFYLLVWHLVLQIPRNPVLKDKFYKLLDAFPDNKQLQMDLYNQNDKAQARRWLKCLRSHWISPLKDKLAGQDSTV